MFVNSTNFVNLTTNSTLTFNQHLGCLFRHPPDQIAQTYTVIAPERLAGDSSSAE